MLPQGSDLCTMQKACCVQKAKRGVPGRSTWATLKALVHAQHGLGLHGGAAVGAD